MSNVALFEIYDHHHHVISQYKVLSSLGHDVTIYCSAGVCSLLSEFFASDEAIKKVVQGDKESLIRFLYRTKLEVETSFDLVWINTVQGHAMWKFYVIKHRIPTIISNGRLSEWFNVNYKVRGFVTLRDFVYHNYATFLTRQLKPRFKAMSFHTPKALEFAKDFGFSRASCVIPFSINRMAGSFLRSDKIAIGSDNRLISLVVTGSIRKKPRDHLGFLNSIKKLDQGSRSRIKFTILSKFDDDQYSRVVRQLVKQLIASGFIIKTYDTWVDDTEYERVLSKADLICSPIRVGDYYACGELTSAMVTSIEYGIPALYQSEYKPDPDLVSVSFYYENISAIHIAISQIINEPETLIKIKYRLSEIINNYDITRTGCKIREILPHVLASGKNHD